MLISEVRDMGQAFLRWLVLTLVAVFAPDKKMLVFYENGVIAGYIGWVVVKGYGTVAFVTPDFRYVYKW
jgi:hypothetical protein